MGKIKCELWRDVVGYEGYYQVSNLGRVRSVDRWVDVTEKGTTYRRFYPGRILAQGKHRGGYVFANLSVNQKRKERTIHRMVAEAFLSNPNNCGFVNHKDGDKKNNCVENLEWCTEQENMRHYLYVLGGIAKRASRPVVCIETGDVFRSIAEAAKFANVSRASISHVLGGLTHTSGGYTWRYAE